MAEIGREVRILTVYLTPEEVAAEADRSSRLAKQIRDEREAARDAAASARREITRQEAELREALERVRTQRTDAPVECVLHLLGGRLAHHARVEIVRLDTGAVVMERPATDAERQRPLPLERDLDAELAKAVETITAPAPRRRRAPKGESK